MCYEIFAIRGEPYEINRSVPGGTCRVSEHGCANVNQQQRIANGVNSGALTNREVGSLERGQAHVDRKEANAAANGRIGAAEQRSVQRSENRQSARVYRKKHNAREK